MIASEGYTFVTSKSICIAFADMIPEAAVVALIVVNESKMSRAA